MSLQALTLPAAQVVSENRESSLEPWAIGLVTFAILLAMLLALLMFGAGRDHS